MTTQTTPESKPRVTFVDAVKMAFRKYADFEGRSTRAEYWWRLLFTSIAGIVCSIIDSFVGSLRGGSSYGPFEALFTLATLMPGRPLLPGGCMTSARPAGGNWRGMPSRSWYG